jgi:hypothetical protein
MAVTPALSPQMLGFNSRPVDVEFVVHKVSMGQVFLSVLRFLPTNIYPPLLHNHSSISGSIQSRQLTVLLNNAFFHGVTTSTGPGPPQYRSFMITLRDTTLDSTPLDEWSTRYTDLCLTTQHPQDTLVPCWFRTRNPSKRATADPRFLQRGHWDWLNNVGR